jgi:rieske iron-sulfur protein
MMRQSAVWIAENAMDAYDCCLFPRSLTQLQAALRKKAKFAHRHSFDRVPPSICVMCKSDQATTSITSTDADLATVTCQDPTRRALILTALATGACMASPGSSVAEEDLPGSSERPQKADVLVFSEGERGGEVIKPQDLQVGGPPVRAWPKDPKTSVVRKGSRLNEVLVVRLDPAELDEETRSRAAGGVVAYSIICVHTGCPITAWVKAASGDKDVFKCVCHNSEYDPRQSGQVIFGPAPRRLPALPLAAEDGPLTVAATFVGKVGAQQTR